jgi:hypothetical protein
MRKEEKYTLKLFDRVFHFAEYIQVFGILKPIFSVAFANSYWMALKRERKNNFY